MAERQKLEFSLDVVRDSLNSALNSAKSAVSSVTKATDGLSYGIGSIFKSITSVQASIVGLAGTVGLAFTFKELAHEAMAAEESVASMNIALASAGIYSEETSRSMQEFASSLQETTKYSDDAVMSVIYLVN